MKDIKAFIFDMDGVILDSESVCDRTWLMAAEEFNFSNIQNALQLCRGTNKNDTLNILTNLYKDKEKADAFYARTSELFRKIESEEGLSLMPGAKETLEYLSSKYIISLASSTRKQTVERQLTKLGVYSYFKTVTTGDMVEHSKPDPEIYLMALKSLNLNAKEACAVEDSPNGLKSAKNAKLKTIMIPDRIKPNEEIKKSADLILPCLNEIKNFF